MECRRRLAAGLTCGEGGVLKQPPDGGCLGPIGPTGPVGLEAAAGWQFRLFRPLPGLRSSVDDLSGSLALSWSPGSRSLVRPVPGVKLSTWLVSKVGVGERRLRLAGWFSLCGVIRPWVWVMVDWLFPCAVVLPWLGTAVESLVLYGWHPSGSVLCWTGESQEL